eukprot:4358219-Pleurochrysis_carterae.AAC.1
MSEQIAAVNALQNKHSDWFFGQRNELETMHQSGQRTDTIFEQADKCGDNCLYTPAGGGRLSSSNQS